MLDPTIGPEMATRLPHALLRRGWLSVPWPVLLGPKTLMSTAGRLISVAAFQDSSRDPSTTAL